MVILALVLDGWLVANYLMMSIASVVGLDRRRLAKFASRVVPSRRGGQMFVETFFFYFKRNQTEASAAIVGRKELAGSLSQAFFPPISTVFRKVLTSDFYFFKTIPRHSWMQFSLARILFCCCWCGGRPQHTKQPLTNCCCCLFGRRHESSPIRRRSGTCSSGPDCCCCGGGR